MITTSQQLRKDYQKIINDNKYITPLLSESEFIELFLNKQLIQINESLLTWSEESKKNYKDTYKRVLSDKKQLLNELDLLTK